MEKIKSDDLLVKILSFLPTKDAVKTSVLSKQWKFLWMWVPNLEYDDSNMSEDESFLMHRWVDKNMPLHRAPVIESLRLKFTTRSFQPEHVKFFVVNAVLRSVRELSVSYFSPKYTPYALLPSNLYICKTLVALELKGSIVVGDCRMVCLPSLKTLILRRVELWCPLKRLLSNCPVLEDLIVERSHGFVGKIFSPFLQRLTIEMSIECHYLGVVIKTPALKYFKMTDYGVDSDSDGYSVGSNPDNPPVTYYVIENMPKLEEAYIDSHFLDFESFIEKFIPPIISVKRLSLCVPWYEIDGECNVFHRLEHLKICSCQYDWTKLLIRLLKDSPNLVELEIYLNYGHNGDISMDPSSYWSNQLSEVPECLLRSLQTFKWTEFYGSQNKMDLVKYILKNACCLKNATILALSTFGPKEKLKMIKELSLAPRGSTSCRLTFCQSI